MAFSTYSVVAAAKHVAAKIGAVREPPLQCSGANGSALLRVMVRQAHHARERTAYHSVHARPWMPDQVGHDRPAGLNGIRVVLESLYYFARKTGGSGGARGHGDLFDALQPLGAEVGNRVNEVGGFADAFRHNLDKPF